MKRTVIVIFFFSISALLVKGDAKVVRLPGTGQAWLTRGSMADGHSATYGHSKEGEVQAAACPVSPHFTLIHSSGHGNGYN